MIHTHRRARLARVLVAAAALGGCAPSPEPIREELLVFGSRASIEIREAPPAQAGEAIAAVSMRLSEFHRDWHPWEPSALTRINAALAASGSAAAPPSILALVRRSQALSQRTDGLFDPSVGGLVALWGFHTSNYPVTTPAPTAEAIDAWLRTRPRMSDLRLEGNRIASLNRAAQLDFGAIAEGVAAEEAGQLLRAHGVAHALINLGGDILALGDADGRPWQIALRDPFGDVLGTVEASGSEAVFSSGGYNKFREAPDGGRWPHLLDPNTGLPARGTASVVVLHGDPVLADVASTTLYIGGERRFVELIDRLGIRCALLLTDDDRLLVTTGMRARLRLLRTPAAQETPVDRGADCTAPG